MNSLSSQLPPELWNKIIRKLLNIDIKCTLKTRLISTFLNQIFKNDRTLNYKILLKSHKDELEDHPFDHFYWICCGTYSKNFKELSENRLEAIKWLVKKYNLMPEEMRRPPRFIHEGYVVTNSAEERSRYYLLLNHITRTDGIFGPTRYDLTDKARLNIIKWFIDELDLSTEEIRQSLLIVEACKYGHLHIIKYLDEKFNLVENNFIHKNTISQFYTDPSPFEYAYWNRHFDILRWIMDRFNIGH